MLKKYHPQDPPDPPEIAILNATIALRASTGGYGEPNKIIANALGRRTSQLHRAKMAAE